MKIWSIENLSGKRCQTSSSTRTRRSHGPGASASLLPRRIRSRSCRRFFWTRFIPSAAPIFSAWQASGRASTPSGWRAASCSAFAHHSIAGGVLVLAGLQFTCLWSGAAPSRASFTSVLRVMQATSPNYAPQRTAASSRGCNGYASERPVVILGRQATV
jgi:hypothetical protein